MKAMGMDWTPSRAQLLHTAATSVELPGDWAEFGVGKGTSAATLQAEASTLGDPPKLWLFDSFEGLPEDWDRGGPGQITPAGSWNRNGIPPLDIVGTVGVEFVIGQFVDTVAEWAKERAEPLALVHIDCDLYSSTRTVFDGIGHLLAPGTLVLFDEYHGYPNAKDHEERAWAETQETRGLSSTILARGKQQALFRVDSVES